MLDCLMDNVLTTNHLIGMMTSSCFPQFHVTKMGVLLNTRLTCDNVGKY